MGRAMIVEQINQIQASTSDTADAIRSVRQTIATVGEIGGPSQAAVEGQGAATSEIARHVQQASHGTEQGSSAISLVSDAS